MNIDFDRKQLGSKLSELSGDRRAVFAAACAERLLPSHRAALEAERALPERAINALWKSLVDNSAQDDGLRSLSEACAELITKENEHGRDAVVLVIYALEAKSKKGNDASIRAGERAYEAIDAFVMAKEAPGVVNAETSSRVLAHPLAQAELRRQRRDIQELLDTRSEDLGEVARRFRERAKDEASIFFGAEGPWAYR